MIFLLLANYPCKTTAESNMKPSFHFSYAFLLFLFLFLHHHHYTFSLKTCPNCGSIQVPYPLSTEPNCGDPSYALHCDPHSQKLYFNTLNGSSYMVLKIMSSTQRMVIQPSPWLQGTTSCVTQDMPISNGLWLNQSLPFKITASNTVFLLNCSPRLLVSPLNCTSSSLCHSYLESSGHVDTKRSLACASGLIHPCCTFVAGGVPSSYRIRLHSSGCKAFRSIIHLDEDKPPNQWEEGLEIQWNPPPEPICKTQKDCPKDSKCSPYGRCLCNKGRNWDPFEGTCLRGKKKSKWKTNLVVSIGVVTFLSLAILLAIITKSCKVFNYTVKQDREDHVLKSRDGEKPCRMFQLKEVKKATNDFSQERMLGSGGFGEVYKGELQDGTMVAVKKARVGNLKSTQQVLNEVEILSQVNHKNLVRLLGCCVESEQPLMVYEYISNGTLYDHLHGIRYSNFLDMKTRLKVAFQTAEALSYLHSSAHTPIYHRDVKSTNILLDDEFNVKVSDFGLSRLANPGLSHVSTCAQGTLGYLDPEYYRNYQLTDKSDVYSYGVVLLEILTSKKVVDFSRDQDDVNLAIHVSQHANNGKIMEVVDQRLLSVEDDNKVIRSIELLLELALDCLREKKGERPSMKDIVQRLLCIIRIVDHEGNTDHHELSA